MKVIIAGSRTGLQKESVLGVLSGIHASRTPFEITSVVSGTARGVDSWGEEWAHSVGLPVERYPADWSQGKQAGVIRNRQMAKAADALILLWDGSSHGSRNMLFEMRGENKPIHEVVFRSYCLPPPPPFVPVV